MGARLLRSSKMAYPDSEPISSGMAARTMSHLGPETRHGENDGSLARLAHSADQSPNRRAGRTSSTHVVASVSDEASGPSYSVPRLCRELANLGHAVELHTVSSEGSGA